MALAISFTQVFPNTKQLWSTSSSVARQYLLKVKNVFCFLGPDEDREGWNKLGPNFFSVAQILLGRRQSKIGISISCRQTFLQLERISVLLKTWHRCLKIKAKAVFTAFFAPNILSPFLTLCPGFSWDRVNFLKKLVGLTQTVDHMGYSIPREVMLGI